MSKNDTEDVTEPTYTVSVNGSVYELNQSVRRAIQQRAEREYDENPMFDCFWKVASPEQYEDEAWENNIHDPGDPVLVIETQGPLVPWERLDQLNVEMQEVGPDSPFSSDGGSADEKDNGNGVRTVDPDSIDDNDDNSREIPRTHFGLTPQDFEEVPGPDGEDEDKIPAKPEEMSDEPALVAWVPDNPEIKHTWGAGEAIAHMYNRVEWNVQKKADQPRPNKEKEDSNDLWESMLKTHGCEVVEEVDDNEAEERDTSDGDDVPKHFKEGKYGGDNWAV